MAYHSGRNNDIGKNSFPAVSSTGRRNSEVGAACCITIANEKDLEEYKDLLESIIDLAHHEIVIINSGGTSDWWFNHLEGVILPEAELLHKYILKDQLFLKYGKDQRLLESTYAITEWIKPVAYTPLGRLICRLQDKIDAQE